MRFRKLPLQERLEAITADQGEAEAKRVLAAEFAAAAAMPGFQAVTDLLRHLEAQTQAAMIEGHGNLDRLLGRIQCIHEIRTALEALLPAPERAKVDWFDDVEEDFVLVDRTPRAEDAD